MRFSICGDRNGRLEDFSAETATEAAGYAQRLRLIGVAAVHIKRDGRPLTDAHEFERLMRQDAELPTERPV